LLVPENQTRALRPGRLSESCVITNVFRGRTAVPASVCRTRPPCSDSPTELPDTTWLRAELKVGRIRAFGELSPQYLGMSPANPRLEPY